jgi:hypothetical protein
MRRPRKALIIPRSGLTSSLFEAICAVLLVLTILAIIWVVASLNSVEVLGLYNGKSL